MIEGGRLVIVTAESCAASDAMLMVLRRYHDRIALVVVSHPDRASSIWQETIRHWRRSGSAFVWFLLVNFTLYRAVTRLSDMIWSGRPARSLQRVCAELGLNSHIAVDINAPETIGAIRAAAPSVMVVCYFDQILHEEVISLPTVGVLNVHTALLPRHRGLFPEIWALSAGEDEIGVTIHEIRDRRIDCGSIVAQHRIAVSPTWSVLRTSRWAHLIGIEMLDEALDRHATGSFLSGLPCNPSYHSFPDTSVVHELRRRGRRLARLSDLRRLASDPLS